VEQYVHTLTHELKSPLTAITASAELLQDELPPEDQRRFAQNIGQQTERLLQLVERLLLLARLEKRHDEFEKQTIDLVELVDTAIEQRQSVLTNKQIQIDNQLPSHLSIQAEPFWLAHAVGNVLDNAIDFSLPDHTITLRLLEQSPKITLCIRNVGAQIPDYALPQVFDRYYSLPRPATGRKSTGIGLTLVKEVMERHQGRAQIENTSDGVQVILTF
jgi:two-component system sensor histidine kinase CreC